MFFEFLPPAKAESEIKELKIIAVTVFIITVLPNKDMFKNKYYAKQSTVFFEIT